MMWFGRKQKKTSRLDASSPENKTVAQPSSVVKYPKPKVLLVDLPTQCAEVLRCAGYNIATGSFGVPYSVPASDGLYPVEMKTCSIPNHEEQEVIIAATACPPYAEKGEGTAPGDGVDHLWQSATDGNIDPRPFFMRLVRPAFDRIWHSGGIFVVLLRARYTAKYIYGPRDPYRGVSAREHLEESSWGFLSELNAFNCSPGIGREITFDPRAQQLGALLSRGALNAEYRCSVKPSYDSREHWIPLATDKFGNHVAGVLVQDEPRRYLLLLPEMPSFHTIILPLLDEWFVQWRPSLFPFHEGQRWIHRPEYEVPRIQELRQQIEQIAEASKQQIQEIEADIENVRAANADWYTILNGTGDELVQAVIRSLRQLGFKKVVDVDAEARERGEGQSLREDIQVHDISPVLIVDVKGVQGRPEDAEATQAEKHALMRAREFRGAVKPLTIINHQRNIPPHDRDAQAYRQEIVENATQTGLGLMTTWDLFRLLRNKERLGWTSDDVMPVFYRTGRIEPIPEHYKSIGTIAHVWKGAFGLVPSSDVQMGEMLAVQVGDVFEELTITSLQVDGQQVKTAQAGSNCGVAYAAASERFREGQRVYLLVRRPLTGGDHG